MPDGSGRPPCAECGTQTTMGLMCCCTDTPPHTGRRQADQMAHQPERHHHIDIPQNEKKEQQS